MSQEVTGSSSEALREGHCEKGLWTLALPTPDQREGAEGPAQALCHQALSPPRFLGGGQTPRPPRPTPFSCVTSSRALSD